MVHNFMRVMAFSSVFCNDHHGEINRLAIYDASICLYGDRNLVCTCIPLSAWINEGSRLHDAAE
jgi:hypothetical protein